MGLENFDQLLADKRHKELLTALRTISANLSETEDSGVIEAINRQSIAIDEFTNKIITIFGNNDKNTVNLSAETEKLLLDKLEQLKIPKTKKEWVFTVERDQSGFIQKITAK